MGGKVTGFASAKIEGLDQQEATLLQSAFNGLIDYYSAPDGEDGDVQRKEANNLVQNAWDQAQRIAKQADGIKALKTEAIGSKADIGRGLKETKWVVQRG